MKKVSVAYWVIGFVLMMLVCPISNAAADIYYFIDANGITHFSDTPADPRFKPYKNRDRGADDVDIEPMPRIYDRLIRQVCDYYLIEFELVKAIIKVESDFQPVAVSRKGAVGLMQLMPETSRQMGVKDPFDPRENIIGGVKYLKYLLKYFDYDLHLSLAAYNAGPSTVIKYRSIPPFRETNNYIKNVIKYRNILRKQNKQQLQAYLE